MQLVRKRKKGRKQKGNSISNILIHYHLSLVKNSKSTFFLLNSLSSYCICFVLYHMKMMALFQTQGVKKFNTCSGDSDCNNLPPSLALVAWRSAGTPTGFASVKNVPIFLPLMRSVITGLLLVPLAITTAVPRSNAQFAAFT